MTGIKSFRERLRGSPTARLALWGAIVAWQFFFLLFALITAVFSGPVMRTLFCGFPGVFLSYACPVFVILTAFLAIYLMSKYSRQRLGVGIVRKKKQEKTDDPDDVEI